MVLPGPQASSSCAETTPVLCAVLPAASLRPTQRAALSRHLVVLTLATLAFAGCDYRKSELAERDSPRTDTRDTSSGTDLDSVDAIEVAVDVADGRLHYIKLGSANGVPLIVINGGPGFDHTSVAPSPVWKTLSGSRPVVLYDQRGTGKSTTTRALSSITVAQLVADLETLREHLQAPRVDVLGWSWGGFLALVYATEHEDRVRRMVLVGSAPPRLADNVYLFEAAFPDITSVQKPNTTAAGQVGCESERIDDYMRMEFYDPQLRERYVAEHRPFAFVEAMCTAAMQDALKLDLTGAVRALKVPTLVTTGRFDMNVAPVVSHRLSRTIPGAKLQIFERSGHMPFIEQPKEFSEVVQAFLEAPGAAR
jgi:proline iminopeptidase